VNSRIWVTKDGYTEMDCGCILATSLSAQSARCPDSPLGAHQVDVVRWDDSICIWCLDPIEGDNDCEACGCRRHMHGLNATDTIRPCRSCPDDFCPDYVHYADGEA
jgi:hypothetical protein